MNQWLINNSAALIGVIGALLGVLITVFIENRRRRKELFDSVKPILINYMRHQIEGEIIKSKYLFVSEGDDSRDITGVFKNTANGILFFDCIKTETKIYRPKYSATVDKDTAFCLIIRNIEGESLRECRIYCHDIFGTPYYYNAHFTFSGKESQIVLVNELPHKGRKKEIKTMLESCKQV